MALRLALAQGAVALALAAVLPGSATGQSPSASPSSGAGPSNPFAPLPAQPVAPQTQPAPTVITTATQPGSGGLTSGAAVGIGVGAAVILAGIAGFIYYDARRRAPIRRRAAAEAARRAGASGSKPRPKPRKLSPAERRRRKRGRAR